MLRSSCDDKLIVILAGKLHCITNHVSPQTTGKQALEEVWPNLEVFFHGGVAFTPYREQYKQVITTPKMHYVETYNASEGYFGTQNDLSDPAMLLMIDFGIFYEFVPLEEVGKENPRAYCLEEVELKRTMQWLFLLPVVCGDT